MAVGDGVSVARPAGDVRPLAHRVLPLPALAAGGGLGASVGRGALRRGRGRRPRLESALRGWDDGPGAPACRRGQKGGGDHALGRSRGGFTTKLHLRTERGGKPVACLLTAGQRHEQAVLPALLDAGAVKRPGRGRPKLRPRRVAGDKGYSSGWARRELRRRGIGPVIPTKTDQRRQGRFDRDAYRERNRVERTINRLKQHRAIATRYEKLEETYHALVTIACILLWL